MSDWDLRLLDQALVDLETKVVACLTHLDVDIGWAGPRAPGSAWQPAPFTFRPKLPQKPTDRTRGEGDQSPAEKRLLDDLGTATRLANRDHRASARVMSTAPFYTFIRRGFDLVSRIEMYRANGGLVAVTALRLGQEVEQFVLDRDWSKWTSTQRKGVAEKAGTYWQQLHRAALLLIEFNRLAALHPKPDPHWTDLRIFAEIGKHFASVVAPAGIPEDKPKSSVTGESVKIAIQRCLSRFTHNTREALNRIRQSPDTELANGKRSP